MAPIVIAIIYFWIGFAVHDILAGLGQDRKFDWLSYLFWPIFVVFIIIFAPIARLFQKPLYDW